MHVYVCAWRGQGNLRPVFMCTGKDLQNHVFWWLLAISQFNGAVCCWVFNVLSFGNSGGKTYGEAGPCLSAVYLETLTSPCCTAGHLTSTLCHVKGYQVAQQCRVISVGTQEYVAQGKVLFAQEVFLVNKLTDKLKQSYWAMAKKKEKSHFLCVQQTVVSRWSLLLLTSRRPILLLKEVFLFSGGINLSLECPTLSIAFISAHFVNILQKTGVNWQSDIVGGDRFCLHYFHYRFY